MGVLRWVALAVVAVLLILFAVSNREVASVGLWPLPVTLELPLYIVVLGSLVIGFLAGQVVTWIGGWRWRREARRSRERIATLERELDAEREQRNEARAPLVAVPR
jgi:uncharacterized integral membrane protein